MATLPVAGYISNAARTQAQIQQALEDIIACTRQVPGAGEPEGYGLISSGTFSPAGEKGIFLVDTEGLAATDDLANIATTNHPDGSCIVIRNALLGRVVTVKHAAGGAGQLNLDRSVDYVMDDEFKYVLLNRRGADWYEVFRGPHRMTSFTVSKSSTFTVAREDLGKVFHCTGTYTVGLTAAAALGNGFLVGVKNVSTGTLTIDANSTELIDGALTLTVPPGWSYMLVCDASAWRTISATGPQFPAENPVMNGTFDVWQRNTTFVSPATGLALADRWTWIKSGAGAVTINRSTNVPTVAQAGVVLNYSLEVDVTTISTPVGAGDFYAVVNRIEGGAWRHFAQRQLTLSFWVMSTITGTNCVAFRNAGATTCYVAEYTISVASTWEYKQITILPSSGTGWNYETGLGLEICFTLSTGSTYYGAAGSWLGANALGTSSHVNAMSNIANFFRVAGVKLELGANATPLDVVSFDREYLRCQRYYQKSFAYATVPATNVGSNTGEYVFPQTVAASTVFNTVTIPLLTPMRSAPVMTLYNPNAANSQVRNRNTSTDCTGSSAPNNTEKLFVVTATTPGGSATSQTLAVHWAADSEL